MSPSPPLDLEELRSLAVAVAYRMLGSRTDAEDLAQEAIVRVHAAAGHEELRSPEAFTTTVTTRLAIDHLRSGRSQRERYVGPWLPEPVDDDPLGDGARASELTDSLSFAFLVVLETLGPVERAAFLLRDVFGFSYGELAEALGRQEPACRQIVARARRRAAEGRARHPVDREEHRGLLERFLAAARAGDLDGLMGMLAPDAVFVSDGGAARRAARHPIRGVDRVARFLRWVGPRSFEAGDLRLTTLNGEPGFVLVLRGRVRLAGTVVIDDGLVRTVHWVLNPDKLRWISP